MVNKEAIQEDDVESFLASLDPKCKRCPPQVVAELLESRAIGCVTALVRRKIAHNQLDLRRDRVPLHYAAKLGFHEAIQLFIRHGVSPSLASLRLPHKLETGAIDYALEPSCDEWNNKMMMMGESQSQSLTLSDLILWLPEWISHAHNFNWWHTIKLLGRANNEGLEMKIYEYARNGQAPKLLWLLLAVPDRVLSPTFLRRLSPTWDMFISHLQYYSLRHFLTAQLAFVVADIWCCHDPQLIKSLGEKRSILTSSLLLLEVFQRAGTQLSNLIPMLLEKEKHHLSNSPVAQQVQTVLEAAGLPLTSLNCPVISTQDSKINYPYPSGPLRRNERHFHRPRGPLAFLIKPAGVCRSQILDSEFSRAIEKLCSYHPCLKEWSPHVSAFKLLFIFCHPELVEKMQCMLQLELKYGNPAEVIHPTYLAELCFIYITEGRIVEFTAALMTVQVLLQLDHPLNPQMSYHARDHEDYTPAFHDFLLHALRRVLDEEFSLTGKSEDNVNVQIFKQKKSVMSSAFLLTRIFDYSSQHSHQYLHSPRYKVIQECRDLKMIVDDVASLLKDSGFVLTPEDVCVDHLEWFSSEAGVSRTRLEEGNPLSFVPHLQTTSCVKEQQATRVSKAIMSTKNIGSALPVGSSVSKLPSRSYNSFPMLRYEGSKVACRLPAQNGVNLVTKKMEAAKWSDSILRKSWKLLRMTKGLRL